MSQVEKYIKKNIYSWDPQHCKAMKFNSVVKVLNKQIHPVYS